jgi:hypothetical protein
MATAHLEAQENGRLVLKDSATDKVIIGGDIDSQLALARRIREALNMCETCAIVGCIGALRVNNEGIVLR